MNIQTISNTLNCTGKGVLGTGLDHCPFDLSDMSGNGQIHLYRRGFKHATTDFTKAYLQGLQANGDLIILKGVFSVEENNSENQIETSSGGIERLGTSGKYKWTFTFTNGLYFKKALSTLQSFGRYDLALSDGYNELHYVSASGEHGGFSIGQIEHKPYSMASGGNAAKSSISIQLTDKRQFDEQFGFISGDEIDFSYNELDGINQIYVSYLTAPVNADTTLKLGFYASADKTTPVRGLEVADIEVKVNDTVVVVSNLVEDSSGKYTATVPALATDDEIASTIKNVVNKDGVLYQSLESKTVVVAA